MKSEVNMNIDIDALRQDLITYFGTAMQIYPLAMIDLTKVEHASDNEIVTIALNNGFNIYDYEIKNKSR